MREFLVNQNATKEMAKTILVEKLDWSWPNGGMWTTVGDVIIHCSITPTKRLETAFGIALRSFAGVEFTRTAKNRLVFVPRP